MRSVPILVMLVLSVGCRTPNVAPCSSATGNTISVQGVASQRLSPDVASFAVGVETRAVSVRDAFNANAQRIERVLAALKQAGVTTEEVHTSDFRVSSVTARSGAPAGFLVSNIVTVRRGDPSSIPGLLQTAMEAGANQVANVSFFVADVGAVQRKGLELALQDARVKAETLAVQSYRSLGPIVCLSEDKVPVGSDAYGSLRALGYYSAPSIESGSQEIRTTVSAVFELR